MRKKKTEESGSVTEITRGLLVGGGALGSRRKERVKVRRSLQGG